MEQNIRNIHNIHNIHNMEHKMEKVNQDFFFPAEIFPPSTMVVVGLRGIGWLFWQRQYILRLRKKVSCRCN